MKSKHFFSLINQIDDDLIEASNPDNLVLPKKKNRFNIGLLVAGICCLALIVNMIIFIPSAFNKDTVPNESYIAIYNKLKDSWEKVSQDNNVDFAPGDVPDQGTTGGDRYEEVTDNQVSGIIEGDVFKRSNKYIFYLSREGLSVYSIAQADSALVGYYELGYERVINCDMYLSEDVKTVIALVRTPDEVHAISLNVENPKNITKTKEFSVKGSYISSRKVGDKLILLTSFQAKEADVDETELYIPSINTGNGYECLMPNQIEVPDCVIDSTSYTVVSMLNFNTLSHEGSMSFLSYTGNLYVSKESLYLTKGYTKGQEIYTTIARIGYTDSCLKLYGTVDIRGRVLNQYSMDEYNGALRVFTTVGSSWWGEGTSASLFIIDIGSMKKIASCERFAPAGEEVKSVRFDKSNAYVCTSVGFTDPVFFFDLSDINRITYTDTGVINGYSNSLVALKDGLLLGIGLEDSSTFKLELYKETKDGVVSIGSFIRSIYTSANYKDYYIDKENMIVGFVGSNRHGENYYHVVKLDVSYKDGEPFSANIQTVKHIEVEGYGVYSKVRGVLIDDYFYVVTASYIIPKLIDLK